MTIPYVTFLKHAQKVTKTAPASRTILKGVYHAPDGSLAVTDSRRLYVAKKAHSHAEPSTVDPKTGEVIDGKYPEVTNLIPEPSDAKYSARLDVKETIKAFKALQAANKLEKRALHPMTFAEITDELKIVFSAECPVCIFQYKPGVVVEGNGDKMAFNTKYFAEALAMFNDVGVTEVTMRYYDSVRPFTLSAGKNDKLLALIMPIRRS